MASPRGFSQTGIELLNAELAKRGIGPAAASGAIAGIMGESGANLDPASFNTQDPGGGSGGIGQWNRTRLIGPSGMLAFAKSAGVPVDVNTPTDAKKVPLAIQAQYLGHELDTTYAGVASQLKTAKTPQDALNIWVNSYENPADKTAAIKQRSQYLTPVATALGNAPPPGSTLNTTGGPQPAAGGAPAVAAAGGSGQGAGASTGNLPGFTQGSPAAKMEQQGLKAFGIGGDQPAPSAPQLPPAPAVPQAPAMGGQFMAQAGMPNMYPRMNAQNYQAAMATALGGARPVLPSTIGSTAQAMPIGAATGMPGLPGTTLNSPSQLQLALMTGNISPYDMYAGMGGGGFGSA